GCARAWPRAADRDPRRRRAPDPAARRRPDRRHPRAGAVRRKGGVWSCVPVADREDVGDSGGEQARPETGVHTELTQHEVNRILVASRKRLLLIVLNGT